MSGTILHQVVGDTESRGTPIWADARFTMEVASFRKVRLELGAGMTFFHSGLLSPESGDLNNIFSFLVSGRFGFPVGKLFYVLTGALFSLPGADSSVEFTSSTKPLELFAGFSFPRGRSGYFEIRMKYFTLNTSGMVQGGQAFKRTESFFGPQLLWVWRLK